MSTCLVRPYPRWALIPDTAFGYRPEAGMHAHDAEANQEKDDDETR